MLVLLIRTILSILDTLFIIDEYPIQRILFIISTSLIILGLEIGYTKIILNIIDHQKIVIKDIFNYFYMLSKYISGLILFYILILLSTIPGVIYLYSQYGYNIIDFISSYENDPYYLELINSYFSNSDILITFILIFIPVIFLIIRCGFWSYFVIDKGIHPIQAIKSSWKITKSKEAEVIIYSILILFFNLFGLLSIIGICITIPITYLFLSKYYRLISQN